MTTPGEPDEAPPRVQGAGRLLWIAPVAALVVMAGLAVLAYLDSRAPRDGQASVEVKLGAAPRGDAAPDPGLVEQTADGPLPIVGKDGRAPWQVYARPFDAHDTRPRLAIVVEGLGLDADRTKAAIDLLPPPVSLAFSPYAHDLAAAIGAARAKGHEVLLGLPLEPGDFGDRDPGPDTLLTSLTPAQNLARLKRIMGRGAAYVGFLAVMGDRFAADSSSIEPVLKELKARGLLYVDDNDPEQSAAVHLARAIGMAWAFANRTIDATPEAPAVDKALSDLEGQARADGAALGLGTLYPVTVARVADWAKTLDGKGIALAPASAIVQRQKLPQK